MDANPYLIKQLEDAVLLVAREHLGGRDIEAQFDREERRVRLFLYLTVVEEVTDSEREISRKALAVHEIEAAPGDAAGFEIFWGAPDSRAHRAQRALWGPVLGFPEHWGSLGRACAQASKQVLLRWLSPANDA